jgi:hypothetical protein
VLRLLVVVALLALAPQADAACAVARHFWTFYVCDFDTEKPGTAVEGDHLWTKDVDHLYYWDGSNWLQIGVGGAPTWPSENELAWRSSVGY